MFKKIAIAHDGSDAARKAFDAAIDLALIFYRDTTPLNRVLRHRRSRIDCFRYTKQAGQDAHVRLSNRLNRVLTSKLKLKFDAQDYALPALAAACTNVASPLNETN